ncbi:MAG: hypothetical protein WBD50_07760 [Candidatus Rhabdochlamydia sp.]
MFTISTNYPFQQALPIRAIHADSSLLKKADDLFKSCSIQEQKNEQDISLLGKTSKDFQFEATRKTLHKRHSKRKEHKQGKKYPIEFKQKVISEVHLSKHKNQVAKNHNGLSEKSFSVN